MEKFICIHGHFYQPPRENAWLEVIEVQDSAHPYHDWNERISAECYGPNAASRILKDGVIKNIVNNYCRISFNFGPTLLSWMEVNDPETYYAILEADRESQKLFGGHGSALAQVYNHIIMPLANYRDKETQILWGIRDFEYRFQRKPEGMWLAETAVDTETLSLLAEHGIKFTVMAPRQAKAYRRLDEDTWHDIGDTGINPRKSYRVNLPGGKSIAVFFYDGDISQAVAFNGLLNDGEKFSHRLRNGFDMSDDEPQLVHIATDGESYGHHHKHGDMALAFCLDHIQRLKHNHLMNYGQFLEKFPPLYEAQIHEYSSWSCVHGVERWRSNCGCNSGGNSHWHQHWRKPLREALDWLRDELITIFEREAGAVLHDPWKARNAYIQVILNRNEENINQFLADHCRQEVPQNKVFRLMEMQRHALLMYTSCGWFFDEVSGIETVQILQYACRAIQLLHQTAGADFEEEFIRRLELAPSNVPAYDNAGNVYRRQVLPSKTNLQRVGMHYAVASLFEEDPEDTPIFNYTTDTEYFIRKEAGEQKLSLGVTRVKSKVTRSERQIAFAVVYLGKHNIIGNLALDMDLADFESMKVRLIHAFEEARLGDVLSLMQTYFGNDRYTLWQLFKDEKRKVLKLITEQSMRELEESLRRVYNRDYPLVNALANNEIPIPRAYTTTFEYILNADLIHIFQAEKINVKELERIMGELSRWGLSIEDPDKVERLAGDSIYRELNRISAERTNVKRIERLNRVFALLKKFKLEPILYTSQNLYFEISRHMTDEALVTNAEWLDQFRMLGAHLAVQVELT
jgi:alpha-amylase/alpha-mannosidase (GH57 family)